LKPLAQAVMKLLDDNVHATGAAQNAACQGFKLLQASTGLLFTRLCPRGTSQEEGFFLRLGGETGGIEQQRLQPIIGGVRKRGRCKRQL
jgi:hypothetical protein